MTFHCRSCIEKSIQIPRDGRNFTEALAEVGLELIIDPAETESGLKCEQCAEIETV